jgi:hypothetical protein
MTPNQITLEPKHIDFADNNVARRRQAAAVERNRQAHNGAPIDPAAALGIHILGARCECAGYLWFKLNGISLHWHTFAQEVGGLPDLGDFVDVKGCRKGWHKLIVQQDDPDDWAYLLVLGHDHPRYQMAGWMWGWEAKQERYWSDPAGDRPAFFIKQGLLRPLAELLVVAGSI